MNDGFISQSAYLFFYVIFLFFYYSIAVKRSSIATSAAKVDVGNSFDKILLTHTLSLSCVCDE